MQAGPGVGQAVVDLGGDGRIHRAQHEAVAFEPPYREGEHALGDAVNGTLQFAEPARPTREFDDHEHRPLVPDAVQDVADAAVGVVLASAGVEFGGGGGYPGVRE